MNTDFRALMIERLKTERARLKLTQPEFAELGGIPGRTYQDWERGLSPVAAEFLMAIAAHGVDVTYVLTGHRDAMATKMSADETALLDNYAHAGEEGRAVARAALSAVKKPARAPRKKAAGGQ